MRSCLDIPWKENGPCWSQCMRRDDAADLAQRLIREHLPHRGIFKWTYREDNARQRCGACHYSSREISLSRHFIELNSEEEVRLTLLHEIAHALCKPGVGHGLQWQRAARTIGAPRAVTNETAHMPQARWQLQCINCRSVVATRHRRSLKLAHVRCRSCGVKEGLLHWQEAVSNPNP